MPGETRLDHVLVVDDDRTIISFIDMALSFDGFKCIGATNGEEAMQKLAEVTPSLILLDISMPLMDGREFCQWLRSTGHSEVPVVLMTAGVNVAKTCKEVGAQACLVKPFDLSDLQSCVRKWATNA
ncbi:MAG: response regulator transcription factor [Chloroflexi bacterium]|nr:response regulator transcription factor [Chloroflexota bacterium]